MSILRFRYMLRFNPGHSGQGGGRDPPNYWSPHTSHLYLATLKSFCINYGDQKVFSIWNHHKCLSQLFLLDINTHVMGLRQLYISFSAGIDLRRSQIMTFNPLTAELFNFNSPPPTWSCVSLTQSTTSSEWKLFRFDKMEVNSFQILLVDVTLYP